jgi:predicted membrane-bound spermidine synthase
MAKVNQCIEAKLYYSATPNQAKTYEDFIKIHAIKREYEKLTILRIITHCGLEIGGGLRYGTRAERAFIKLLGRGLIYIDQNGLAQLSY